MRRIEENQSTLALDSDAEVPIPSSSDEGIEERSEIQTQQQQQQQQRPAKPTRRLSLTALFSRTSRSTGATSRIPEYVASGASNAAATATNTVQTTTNQTQQQQYPRHGRGHSREYNRVHQHRHGEPAALIPADIIREIVSYLSPSDVLGVSLASKTLQAILVPTLYNSVSLKSSRRCSIALTMLGSRPDLSAHIRKLTVRPNYYLSWPKPDRVVIDELWVAGAIEDMARAGNLARLETLDWDGLEMPKDTMWAALRKGCPDLKNIFTNAGLAPLDPHSHLFEFSNLKTFSFIVRYGLDGSELFPLMEALPPNLWDMLTQRCPDLEELAICSFSSSSRLFDFLPVTSARWPHLHSLTLGSFGYQNDFSLGPADEPALSRFLSAHTSLKYIRMQWNFRRWMSPSEVHMDLTPDALPNLDTFVGIYQQLAKIPNRASIETLDLTCEPLHESRLEAICPVLSSLTSLTSLDLWTHVVHPNFDTSRLFEGVLMSCPKLTDLHFMCTMSFADKPMKQLLSNLYLLPDLKRFSLTKGHRYADENMLGSALQVLRHKPTIQQINIRWAREKAPNHLKQEGTYDIETGIGGWGAIGEGEKGPVCVVVREQGIPLLGRPFKKEYRYVLPKRRWKLLASPSLSELLVPDALRRRRLLH